MTDLKPGSVVFENVRKDFGTSPPFRTCRSPSNPALW